MSETPWFSAYDRIRKILLPLLLLAAVFASCRPAPPTDKLSAVKKLSQERRDTLLAQAAENKDLAEARLLMAAGANPNSKGAVLFPPLIHAVFNGDTVMAAFLIENGAAVNKKFFETPIAALNRTQRGPDVIKMYEILISHGADIRGNEGIVALSYAIKNKNPELVEFLIGRGVDPNALVERKRTTLQLAAGMGNLEMVKLLLKLGANPKAAVPQGGHLMFDAAASGNIELVDYLIELGQPVNTPVDYLVGLGMPFNGAFLGYNPIDFAIKSHHLEMAKHLVKRGADPKSLAVRGKTMLHEAARYGKDDVIRYMVKNGADVNMLNEKGSTPLHYVVRGCYVDTLKLLLKLGAKVNVANNDGNTPLRLLTEKNNHWCRPEMEKILIEHGAKP